MPRKSFVTTMPDRSGAFLRASRIIAKHSGNIVRVSYNRAVDLHMLFLDVSAPSDKLAEIEKELCDIGYINKNITQIRIMEITVKIPDKPGAVLPVLEVLDNYDINISYINSSSSGKPYQDFKVGLLIENPTVIKAVIDEISKIYQIDIAECNDPEECPYTTVFLDNTVFYVRLANEMQAMFNLSTEKTMEFIAESNRILQMLQDEGEDAHKVFDYIKRFAYFVNSYRGDNYKVDIEKLRVNDRVTLYSIQPKCGSNTYVFDTGDEYVFIDNGYAIYKNEMRHVFNELFPDWESRKRRVYITHADVDHCGLLSIFKSDEIYLNQKSYDSFKRQLKGLPDFRENTELGLGYSKISRIISGYRPPDLEGVHIIDSGTPEEHSELIKIADMYVADLDFEIYEGSGGHVYGEMVFVCEKAGIVFTGDILVNIHGFSKERAEFNSLAPYLLKSVNIDSQKANEMRKKVVEIIESISEKNHRPCIFCGGHGPLSEVVDGKPVKMGEGKEA